MAHTKRRRAREQNSNTKHGASTKAAVVTYWLYK